MSHSDHVENLPKNFERIASTQSCSSVIIQNLKQKIFGVQFHQRFHIQFRITKILEILFLIFVSVKKHGI